MVDVVEVEVAPGPAAPTVDETEMTVIVKMRFSQREFEEGLDYGVMAYLFRHSFNHQYTVFITGILGQLIDFIPPQPMSPTVALGSMTIKPEAAGIRGVRFKFTLKNSEVPSGTSLQALATVTPEISGAFNRSAPTVVPPAPIVFPPKQFEEKDL